MRHDSATKNFPRGMLIAWNPILRKKLWTIPQKADWNGGLLATVSNLVFQGTAQGDFICYDGESGKVLWNMNLGGGIIAAPISYELNGTQYISIAVGWGGGYGMKKKFAPLQMGRVFTFKLNGNASFPKFNESVDLVKPNILIPTNKKDFEQGETLFWKYCGTCHVVDEGRASLS